MKYRKNVMENILYMNIVIMVIAGFEIQVKT